MVTDTLLPPPRTMMEVFNSLPEGTHIQLIENNIVLSPAPLDMHQYTIGEIFGELRTFLQKSKLGMVRIAPYDVYLDGRNAYQPDICVILNNHLLLIKKNGLHGAPDLVIEILSPTTARYDLNEKKMVYERCGVTEYWVADPADRSTMSYWLANGKYHEFFEGEGVLEIKLFELKIEF